MNKCAVITGDIFNSKKTIGDYRSYLLRELKKTFRDINELFLKEKKIPFEIFRGDRFQGIIKNPELALIISLIIRAKLKSLKGSNKKNAEIQNHWDARISIGIGEIEFKRYKIMESDGKAFTLSGATLDQMKKDDERLKIITPWQKTNEELNVQCAFADAIINRWSVCQAETIYLYLLKNKTQKELAATLQISQPAVHKRLISSNIDTFSLFINRFEKTIKQNNIGTQIQQTL